MFRREAGLLMAVVVASIACRDSASSRFNPFAPTAVTAPPTPPPAREGVPIWPGQTVAGTLSPSDPPCGSEVGGDPPEPCQLFVWTADEGGILTVRATTSGSGPLTLRVRQSREWGQAVQLSVAVQAGSSYEIGVALHDGAAASSQRFELTTSFELH